MVKNVPFENGLIASILIGIIGILLKLFKGWYQVLRMNCLKMDGESYCNDYFFTFNLFKPLMLSQYSLQNMSPISNTFKSNECGF